MESKGQYILFLLKILRALNFSSSINLEHYYWRNKLFLEVLEFLPSSLLLIYQTSCSLDAVLPSLSFITNFLGSIS